MEQDLTDKKENLKEYLKLNKIPCSYEYKFYEVNKKYYEVKCTYYSLGIVIGKKTLTIEDKTNEKETKRIVKKQAKKEALNVLKNFINDKKSIFPPYGNKIELNLDNEILTNPLTEDDTNSNIYIRNVTQNFFSPESTKAQKISLNEINNIIADIMNNIKRENKINGSYLIKKFSNYEVWNLINYEIILFVEFEIDFIEEYLEKISERIKNNYKESILEFDGKEEVVNKNEKIIIDSNRIRVRLNNGCTFCIYVGTNVYEEMLTKYVSPFKYCPEIEREFIQFSILWSNLVLYQNFEDEPEEGFCYYLKEQERIFTTLALYAWDYTSKSLKKSDDIKKDRCYILSFTNLIYMLIHYKKLNVVWYSIKESERESPILMDPISNNNLITSRNKFIWDAYKKYAKKIFDKKTKKIKLFLDEENEKIEENGEKINYKLLFKPQVFTNSFTRIKSVYFVLKEDPDITVKSSMYHIPRESENKSFLNVVFNSLQSYLLLNLYNTENSIEIQKLNNEKNEKNFEDFNEKLKKELQHRIITFFKSLNPSDNNNEYPKIKYYKEDRNKLLEKVSRKEKEINKLVFILGNNVNVSIEIAIKMKS